MPDYDFNILQFNEFESFSRDLLQKKNNIFVESFTTGRDGGIDLRYALTNDKKAIVQVKRYKSFADLCSNLQSEIPKVQKINPSKYYICTSVGLTPNNKDKIKNLFNPYIKDTEDILGRDDLNNLLSFYPEIEKKYYKLWLSSTNILDEIIHKDVYNWSAFELDKIKDQIIKYVPNESFNKANEILKEYRYVIISGIPGIGKTTLAHMLIYDILANGYEMFVCIEENLDEAAGIFQKGKKQIFFFDDFLGSNVFEKHEKRFDRKLIDFIIAAQREKDKLFIMTTREYILSEAKLHYELFQNQNLEIAKCTLDIGNYSKYIRAKILYNHLVDADLPNEYIDKLLVNNNYDKIISHKNFNPRIIETYIIRGLWKSQSSDEFILKFLDFFNNPILVWENAFEKLDINARYALLVLSTMGAPVYLNDWYLAFNYFCDKSRSEFDLYCDQMKWKQTLKVLEDCFIQINKHNDNLIIDFFNPSVKDFIISYLSNFDDIINSLIRNSFFTDQLHTLFREKASMDFSVSHTIVIKEDRHEMIVTVFNELTKQPKTCNFSYYLQKEPNNDIDFLINMFYSFPTICRKYSLIEENIKKDSFSLKTITFYKRTKLLSIINWDKMTYDIMPIINQLKEESKSVDNFLDLILLYEKLNLDEIKLDKQFLIELEEQIYYEIDTIETESEGVKLKSLLEDIESHIKYLSDDIFVSIEDKILEVTGPDDYNYSDDEASEYRAEKGDDKRILELFTSLYEKN